MVVPEIKPVLKNHGLAASRFANSAWIPTTPAPVANKANPVWPLKAAFPSSANPAQLSQPSFPTHRLTSAKTKTAKPNQAANNNRGSF